MIKPEQFEHLLADLLQTYKLLLLNGNLHKRVVTHPYEKNKETWNTLLRSLEAGIVLGLQRILEKDDYFGRAFPDEKLNDFAVKTKNIRDKFIAHLDLSVVSNMDDFLKKNQSSGSEVVEMMSALKERAIQYKTAYKMDIDVHALFVEATQTTMKDLDDWLRSFKEPL